jgi:hypothetical protein
MLQFVRPPGSRHKLVFLLAMPMPPSLSLWWHTIFFFLWFPNRSGSASIALLQKVQTPSPTPAPQDRHSTRRLTNTYARELSNPRIPLLSRHDEWWAKPRPWPWLSHCYWRCTIVVTRGRTATRAAPLLVPLCRRGEATMGQAFPFRLRGRRGGE